MLLDKILALDYRVLEDLPNSILLQLEDNTLHRISLSSSDRPIASSEIALGLDQEGIFEIYHHRDKLLQKAPQFMNALMGAEVNMLVSDKEYELRLFEERPLRYDSAPQRYLFRVIPEHFALVS